MWKTVKTMWNCTFDNGGKDLFEINGFTFEEICIVIWRYLAALLVALAMLHWPFPSQISAYVILMMTCARQCACFLFSK